jgi:glycosyltransferase involved in cell wall biosynthesis
MASSIAPEPTSVADPERLPNLFIVGAPRSGTSFLHHALSLAPSVYMSTVKEPGYFSSVRDLRRGLDYYLDAYFPKAAGFPIRGESTPWYLYSDLARRGIADLPGPTAPKIVVAVRRPSRRALSIYRSQVRVDRERRSFDDAVSDEIAEMAAGRLEPDVRRRYVWGGLYVQQIEKWREDFGPENVAVVVLEDLIAAPGRVWGDLDRFLGGVLGPSQLDHVSERDQNRTAGLRWPRLDAFIRSFEGRDLVVVEGVKGVLPPGLHRRVLQKVSRINRTVAVDPFEAENRATLAALDDFYSDETARVETLLGRSLPAWAPAPAVDAAAGDTAGADVAARPLRIVHLVARSHRRGAELVALELADELSQLGHENRVVALGPASDGGQEPGMVPLASSNGMGPRDLVTRLHKVRRLLAAEPVDFVLAHGGWAAQIAAIATPRHGPLLVWQRILGFPTSVWRPARRRWWHAIANRFDAAIALTTDLQVELRDLGYRGPVWVIPNFRQPDRFVRMDRGVAAARLRAEIGVSDQTRVIGFVGHLIGQKRPERAIEVLARVIERGQPAHLVIAGDGPLRPDLEREVRERGLERSVTFLGYRNDVEWVLGGVEIALLTSEAEGIPGIAIEALMAGCPMVSLPVGGVDEVFDNGVTGVIVAAPAPSLMADAVVALLDDDARREAMGLAAREQTPRFSATGTAAVYAGRLGALLAASAVPRR